MAARRNKENLCIGCASAHLMLFARVYIDSCFSLLYNHIINRKESVLMKEL